MEKFIEKILPYYEYILASPLYTAIFCILLSIIIAKLSDVIFTSLLRRMAGNTKTSIDDRIIDIIHKPIYYTILFIGLGFSISLIDFFKPVQFIINGSLKTMIVIIWGSAIFKSFIYIIQWYSSSSGVEKHHQKRLMPLFDNLGKIVIFIAAVYFIFVSWGVNVTGWLASAGILGVVLGFAAKDTLANLFAGIFFSVGINSP